MGRTSGLRCPRRMPPPRSSAPSEQGKCFSAARPKLLLFRQDAGDVIILKEEDAVFGEFCPRPVAGVVYRLQVFKLRLANHKSAHTPPGFGFFALRLRRQRGGPLVWSGFGRRWGGGAEPKTGEKPIFRPPETRPRPPLPFPPRRPIAPRVGAHTKPNGELLALIALADRSPHLRPPESPAVIDFPNSRGFQFPAGNARSPERRPRRRRPKNSRARRGSAAPGANPRMSGSPSPAFIGLYPHMFMWKKDGSPKTFLGKSANPAILNAIMRTRLRES